MKPNGRRLLIGICFPIVAFLIPGRLPAQEAGATLTGLVSHVPGEAIAAAKLTVKNVATGLNTDVETDKDGNFSLQNLPPGDYEVSASAPGFGVQTAKVTLAAGANPALKLVLTATEGATGPSLADLGFPTTESKGSTEEQKRLDKREHMLKLHQRFGLITLGPLIATVALGPGSGGHSTSTTNRDVHVALGAVTGDLYGITAYYAIFAPRVPGTQTHGPIRLHKALAWIHGPGMILTPILGVLAYNQKSNGEKVHGLASAHGPVAIVTAGAYGAAMLAMTFKW